MVQLRRLVFKGVCCDVIGMGCGSDLQDLWFSVAVPKQNMSSFYQRRQGARHA